jgi:hypothetical protein
MSEVAHRKSSIDAFPELVKYTENDPHQWALSAFEIAMREGLLTDDQYQKAFDESEKQKHPVLPNGYDAPIYQLLKAIDPGRILHRIGFFDFFAPNQYFECLTGRLIQGEKIKHGTVITQKKNLLWYQWAELALFPEAFSFENCTYLEFLQIPVNESGVINFANKFGFLGGDFTFWYGDNIRGEKSFHIFNARESEGEFIDDWFDQINTMKDYYLLWRAIKENNLEFLTNQIKIHQNKTFLFLSPSVPGKDYWMMSSIFSGQKLSINNLEYWAKIALKEGFSERTNRNSPILELEGNKFGIKFKSDSLIAKLWLDFALAVANDSKIVPCAQCRKFFTVGEKKNSRKKGRLYCSTQCRNDFNNRKPVSEKNKRVISERSQ